MARGRKAQASLTVAPVTELKNIPKPPTNLTPVQGEVWRLVMSSSAGDFIQSESYPILVEYCRTVVVADEVAEQLNAFDPTWLEDEEGLRRWDRLQAMQDRAGRRAASLATKLRITPSTRTHPEKAGTAERNKSKRKPWQYDG